MKILQTIISRDQVLVKPYAPGLVVDMSGTPADSDATARGLVPGFRQDDNNLWSEPIIREANVYLQQLGISGRPDDFQTSLLEFAGTADFSEALTKTLAILAPNVSVPADLAGQIRLLFDSTGLLQNPPPMPTRLYCHVPGAVTRLPEDGTHFGYVLDGNDNIAETADRRRYPLYSNSYFSFPEQMTLHGDGRIVVITRLGYRGTFILGGSVPAWGVLKYIDGCTDAVLVPPQKKGHACLNALYFPPGTRQTQHYHPTLRAGLVIGGGGTCKAPSGNCPLEPGSLFILPPRTWHAFETTDSPVPNKAALTIVAYHPDSDFGPTDEDHPMLNRTYCSYLHRLRSFARMT